MRLSDFKALSFDCYGTLIDWETGILAELKPWLQQKNAPALVDDQILAAYAETELAIEQAHPAMVYRDVLAEVHRQLGRKWGVAPDEAAAKAFGDSVPRWPAFADSVEALAYLKQHYMLVILSNVHNDGIAASAARMGKPFHHIFTAEMIGSYKPTPRNFEYLIEKMQDLGVPKGKILHTAQSLFHDHVPAQAIGLASAWIDRRAGKPGQGATVKPAQRPKVPFRFNALGELAAAHQAEQSNTRLRSRAAP